MVDVGVDGNVNARADNSYINDAITGNPVITTGDPAVTAFFWQPGASPTLLGADGTPPLFDSTSFTSTVDWGDGSAPFVTPATWLEPLTSQHLYANAGGYYTISTTSVANTPLWGAWVDVVDPQLRLSEIAEQTVAPGKSVDVTASYTGLVGDGYAFIDWGDGKGSQPLGETGGGAVPASGSISGHYDSVPASGLAGTLYLYDMHGKWVSQNFRIASNDSSLIVGAAQDEISFTPIYLHVDPQSYFTAASSTFTLTYSASNPNNDTQTGSGTDADPYVYTPAAGDYTLWTTDGTGALNQADVNSAGNFLNAGVSYPLSALGQVDQTGRTFVIYVEAVAGTIAGIPGAITATVIDADPNPTTVTSELPASDDGGACFAAGTLILLGDGTSKAVEKIERGETVLAAPERDPEGQPVPCRVMEVFYNPPAALLNVTVAGEAIRTTLNHPFYVRGKGWVTASNLKVGDRLRTETGGWKAVQELARSRKFEPVFNLRVEPHHTYFVSLPAAGVAVLVHNYNVAGDPTTPQEIKDRAYGDAKQQIGWDFYGIPKWDYAAQDAKYQTNKNCHDMVEDLVPGKIRYYEKLQADVAATLPAPHGTTETATEWHVVSGAWTLVKTGVNVVRPHPVDMFNAASAQADILFDPNESSVNHWAAGFGVAGNTILLVTDLVPGVGLIARKLGLKAGTKIAEVVLEKAAVTGTEKDVEKGVVNATEKVAVAEAKQGYSVTERIIQSKYCFLAGTLILLADEAVFVPAAQSALAASDRPEEATLDRRAYLIAGGVLIVGAFIGWQLLETAALRRRAMQSSEATGNSEPDGREPLWLPLGKDQWVLHRDVWGRLVGFAENQILAVQLLENR